VEGTLSSLVPQRCQVVAEYSLEDLCAKSKSADIDKLPKLVLIFDNAHHLMTEFSKNNKAKVQVMLRNSLKETDWYRGFRGTFRSFEFYWQNVLITTVSTVAKVDKFYPPLGQAQHGTSRTYSAQGNI
jgi:hypothetical protein